jgi:hypothetical protein
MRIVSRTFSPRLSRHSKLFRTCGRMYALALFVSHSSLIASTLRSKYSIEST